MQYINIDIDITR